MMDDVIDLCDSDGDSGADETPTSFEQNMLDQAIAASLLPAKRASARANGPAGSMVKMENEVKKVKREINSSSQPGDDDIMVVDAPEMDTPAVAAPTGYDSDDMEVSESNSIKVFSQTFHFALNN
jgi:hypothetical protein|tara:strand:- start:560 stop:934 length:375 start_codon:yes stop_codon:yes gene_type:complete